MTAYNRWPLSPHVPLYMCTVSKGEVNKWVCTCLSHVVKVTSQTHLLVELHCILIVSQTRHRIRSYSEHRMVRVSILQDHLLREWAVSIDLLRIDVTWRHCGREGCSMYSANVSSSQFTVELLHSRTEKPLCRSRMHILTVKSCWGSISQVSRWFRPS